MREVQYVDDGKTAIFDGISFRRDKRTGYYLAGSARDGGRRKRLHVYVWEYHNGAVPDGYHVHHIDHDKSNNDIDNLQILSKEEHLRYHAQNISEERREKLRKQLIEKAVPKSKVWHASKEGRQWHRENGKAVWKNRKPIKYECTYCGKEFKTLNHYSESSNRFCSNNCKSAYRRKMGYDNVKRDCEICGAEFVTNKYSKRKRCDECKHIRKKLNNS